MNHRRSSGSVAPLAHIYTLSDPRDSAVRYVGETTDIAKRLHTHWAMRLDGNERKQQWFYELRASGLKSKPTVLCKVPLPDRRHWESKWITHFHLAGCDLVNMLTADRWQELGERRAAFVTAYQTPLERAYLLGQCRAAVARWRREYQAGAESELAVIFG